MNTENVVKLPSIREASRPNDTPLRVRNFLKSDRSISQRSYHQTPLKLNPISLESKQQITKNMNLTNKDLENHLKTEIAHSEYRIKSVRAGSRLNFVFPASPPKFVEPKRENYHRDHLGTPQTENLYIGLSYTGRKRHVSLMNSSPHMPYLKLPSLKEVILSAGVKKQEFLDNEDDLSRKIERLERMYHHKLPDKDHKDTSIKNNFSSKLIGSITADSKYTNKEFDPVHQLFQRCKEFEEGKEHMNKKLNDLLATLQFDRSEAV